MIPVPAVTAVGGVALALTVLSHRRWITVEPEGESLIAPYVRRLSGRQSNATEIVFGAMLPGLVETYLEVAPVEVAAISSANLRTAAQAMDDDPTIADYRFRENVARPLLMSLIPRFRSALPKVTRNLVLLPNVLQALVELPNHTPIVDDIRRKLRFLSRTYLAQMIAFGALVALSVSLYFSPRFVTVVAALFLGLTLHLVTLEGWRLALWVRLTVRLSVPEMVNNDE